MPPSQFENRNSKIENPLLPALLKLLQSGTSDIDTLCQQLATTPEVLEQLLDSQECADRLRLATKLAHTRLKLQVQAALPQATAKLIALTDSDKPEVARRAATTLLHLNGVSTQPPRQPPYVALPKQESKIREATDADWDEYIRSTRLFQEALWNYPNPIPHDRFLEILEDPHETGTPSTLNLPDAHCEEDQLAQIQKDRDARIRRRQEQRDAEARQQNPGGSSPN